MYMESLEDDNIEEFTGGTLQIHQEITLKSAENTPEDDSDVLECKDNELNANLDQKPTNFSNLITLPRRITETLWSCRNNNNLPFTRALTSGTASDNLNLSEDAQDFFSFRENAVEEAVQDCIDKLVNFENDGETIAHFLLTEITMWDTEKERLVIMTSQVLYIVKYDFIAQKQLEYKRVNLQSLENIIIGDLVYPSASLVPDRKSRGVRLLWDSGKSVGFTQKWNPFNNETPCVTFTSHPLFRHPDCLKPDQKEKFSMDSFCQEVINVVEKLNNCEKGQCLIQHKDIVLQTYLGIGSLIYNRNSLGFFKVRGKFSF